MNASDEERATSISKAQSLDEVAQYWDDHSLAEHWDETDEVEFEVQATSYPTTVSSATASANAS